MCVAITLNPGTNLTVEEIAKMHQYNKDGFGFAWHEDGFVHWWKTLNVVPSEIAHILSSFEGHSRIAHFRLSTAGGIVNKLCHPFEIGPRANCRVQGSSSNRVMIHNGHWTQWDDVRNLLNREGLLPDDGPWSDSRLAAYLASEDEEWLQALGGRVAILDTEGGISRLGDWTELRPGLMVSNTHWNSDHSRGGYNGWRSWQGWGEEEKEKGKEEKSEEKKPIVWKENGQYVTYDPATKNVVPVVLKDKESTAGKGKSSGKGREGSGRRHRETKRQYARRLSEGTHLSQDIPSTESRDAQEADSGSARGASLCQYTQERQCGLVDEMGGEDCRIHSTDCIFEGGE